MNPSIIVPVIAPAENLERILKAQYEIWRSGYLATQPKFEPVNIRFTHNPDWRNRFLSIQSAHDGNHIVWKATKIVFGSFLLA